MHVGKRFAIAVTVACMLASAGGAHGDPVDTSRSGVAGLEDRLKTGLRVQSPRDVTFVETVALRVREGRLPEHLVDSTYLWAVRRGKKYPFPAFEHVIRLKAQRLGVSLDAPATPVQGGSSLGARR